MSHKQLAICQQGVSPILSIAQHRVWLEDVTKCYLAPKTYEVVARRVGERERGDSRSPKSFRFCAKTFWRKGGQSPPLPRILRCFPSQVLWM